MQGMWAVLGTTQLRQQTCVQEHKPAFYVACMQHAAPRTQGTLRRLPALQHSARNMTACRLCHGASLTCMMMDASMQAIHVG